MGHERLGLLPRSRKWREIVNLLSDDSTTERNVVTIANNTLNNVKTKYRFIQRDPNVLAIFEFLVVLSHAYSKPNAAKTLSQYNIAITPNTSPFDLSQIIKTWVPPKSGSQEYRQIALSAVMDAIHIWHQDRRRQMSFLDLMDKGFNTWQALGKASGFCEFSRLYFAKFTERYLDYFLSREASVVINNSHNRDLFEKKLELVVNDVSKHAFETSKIMQSFAAGWFNKYATSSIPDDSEMKRFVSHAFGKIREELAREVERIE